MVSSADYGNIRFDIILIIFIQEYREGRGIDLASAVMCINILSDFFSWTVRRAPDESGAEETSCTFANQSTPSADHPAGRRYHLSCRSFLALKPWLFCAFFFTRNEVWLHGCVGATSQMPFQSDWRKITKSHKPLNLPENLRFMAFYSGMEHMGFEPTGFMCLNDLKHCIFRISWQDSWQDLFFYNWFTKLLWNLSLRVLVVCVHRMSIYGLHDVVRFPATHAHDIRFRNIHGAQLWCKIVPELV